MRKRSLQQTMRCWECLGETRGSAANGVPLPDWRKREHTWRIRSATVELDGTCLRPSTGRKALEGLRKRRTEDAGIKCDTVALPSDANSLRQFRTAFSLRQLPNKRGCSLSQHLVASPPRRPSRRRKDVLSQSGATGAVQEAEKYRKEDGRRRLHHHHTSVVFQYNE